LVPAENSKIIPVPGGAVLSLFQIGSPAMPGTQVKVPTGLAGLGLERRECSIKMAKQLRRRSAFKIFSKGLRLFFFTTVFLSFPFNCCDMAKLPPCLKDSKCILHIDLGMYVICIDVLVD
jgi:hypothetical protein